MLLARSRSASFQVQHKRCRAVRTTSSKNVAVTRQLPIFPLGIVPFPSTTVPLVIFEARYRVLFNTLLSGFPSVEEGLVQEDSPFCGTRQFGMCYFSRDRLAGIGATLHIDEYVHMEDGRLVVTTKGIERFRIKSIIKERPVLVCEVEIIEDEEDDGTTEALALAAEVRDLFRETFRLHVKVQKLAAAEELTEPEDLSLKTPRELSYFVASTFMDSRAMQQALLEEDSTVKRLELEKEILKKTMQFYVAASAVKQAFSSDSTPPPDSQDGTEKSAESSGPD